MSDYVLVPREPTIHMVEAVREWNRSGPRAPLPIAEETNLAAVIWDLMLAAAPSAWRDIAEAPKDGTPILATNADYAYTLQRCGVYYWEGGETEALSGKVLVEPGWMHQSDDDDDERVTYLTHFMPLPPSPEGREG